MKVLLTCGGTAGHINPAIAVADRLRELNGDSEFLFLGAEGKMEMDLVPRAGYEIKALKITNISRGRSLKDIRHNLQTLRNVIGSEQEARQIIRSFQPDVVLGTGGYVCYPVLHEAARYGIPTLLHESNAVPGLTTKLLARQVSCVMTGYEESKAQYEGASDVRVTGTPVRVEFGRHTRETARRELGIAPSLPLVVSMWGSLGSGHMNATMLRMLPLMEGQQDFYLIHATGSYYYNNFTDTLKTEGIDPEKCGAEIREYIFDAPLVLSAADLVLCRAGASTLAELSSIGKPALIVPSPNVTNNHQEKNARLIEKAGGAKVLLEGEFDEQSLLETIREMLRNRDTLAGMAEAMASLSVTDAVDRIADTVMEYTKKGG